ncbi:MAG: hypothetical protein NTY09_12495 [bacterium]|nr:hypothetical protein [bacterium]
MRNRLSWLIAISLIALFMASCDSGSNNGSLGGSEALIRNLFIGNVPIQVEQTHNIPMSQVTSMRFELNRAVTVQSLTQVFSFEILVSNMDTGQTFRITDSNLEENGEIVWVEGGDNKILEYRMTHTMDRIVSGGQMYMMGTSGNELKVTVVYMVGQSADGMHWSYTDDTFYIVMTDSNQDI